MFTGITHSQIYVLDQDEALDFYVGKLGLEVNTDADLGFMRWLTVNVPGQPDREVLLERPGPPRLSEETAEQVRELLTKGATGGFLIFGTEDCRKTY
jgi:catechol 2,3-dioxygenase-like lactoylglutathione lyase family enzyme